MLEGRLGQGLTALDDALNALLAAGAADLDGLEDAELVEYCRSVEQVRNRLSLLDHQIAATLEAHDVADHLSVRSTGRLLAQTARISTREAGARLAAARELGPNRSMTGQLVSARRPVLAAEQTTGSVSPAQVSVILGCLERLERLAPDHCDEQVISAAERTLITHARTFDAGELRRCADRLVECVDPDGVLAGDHAQQALRELHVTRRADGLYSLRGVLTPQLGASLTAVLDPLARVRPTCEAEGSLLGADDRDLPARMHDALDDVVHRALAAGDLPATGGLAATVLITLTDRDLCARGFGRTPEGDRVAVADLGQWAGEAEVVDVVTRPTGEVLELGRRRRIASREQTLALVARDGACSFPGCDHPPRWCERHHVQGWHRGGPTDVGNLTLLCRYHHRRFEQHGWSCRMIGGLPHWIPPRWVDPDQHPILNRRLAERLDAADVRSFPAEEPLPELAPA